MKSFTNFAFFALFLFVFSAASLNAQVAFDIQFTSDFNRNAGITVLPNGEVLVADHKNHLVKRFDNDGNFISSFGGSGTGDGQFNRPGYFCYCT